MRQTVYKNYLLGLLTLILLFNCVDRLALGLLLQDIKADLQLSDTQLGFLSGIAFALFYSVMGIPIARWADRGNRVAIIALTAALWSAAVALCGAAASFVQLMLIRVAVAVGEAGCIPPAFSLIADYFNRAERPRATAIYGMGGPLSLVVGFLLAGWLNQLYGWRMTFVLIGLPGIALAALAWFTLKEPRREKQRADVASDDQPAVPVSAPTFKEVFVTLWASRTFRHLLLSLSVMFFFNYGILLWQPAFFIRSHGLETQEIGMWLTAVYGIGGVGGAYLSGELATRYAAKNESLQLQVLALALASSGLLYMFVYLSSSYYVAFILMGFANVGVMAMNGPLFSTIQTLVPDRMRAVAFALVYLFANLIGMGLGPLATGVLSDVFRPLYGEESLRYVLLALSPGYFWVGWHAWQASKTVARDMAAAHVNLDGVPPSETDTTAHKHKRYAATTSREAEATSGY